MTQAVSDDDIPPSGVHLEAEIPPEPPPWDRLWTPAPDEWFKKAPPPRRWLFRDTRQQGSPGVFPLGKAGQLVAAGGVGKTMALVSLARAVATGSNWFDTFSCTEPGPVLLLLGEEDIEECHRRLYNMAKREGAPPSGSIVVVPLAGHPCAMLESDGIGPVETAFTAWLRERVATRNDWRLILVDPMSRFAGVDAEKDNALGTRFVQTCESFAMPDRSMLISHHTPQTARGKNAIEAPRGRGVTAAFDGFRWEAALSSDAISLDDIAQRQRLGEIVTLQFTKSNYSRKPDPLLLRRDEHGALVPIDSIDRDIIAQAKSGKAAKAAKNADRQAARDEQEAKDAAKRERREAERRAEQATREGEQERALREILTTRPGIKEKELIFDMRAVLGSCSEDTTLATVARARLAGWLEIRPGAKNAKTHFLIEGGSC